MIMAIVLTVSSKTNAGLARAIVDIMDIVAVDVIITIHTINTNSNSSYYY